MTAICDFQANRADPRNLTNPDAFKTALNQPGVYRAAFTVVNIIVFAETGLLFFLLSGDSFHCIIGLVAALSGWNVWLLIAALCMSAIVGEINAIGKRSHAVRSTAIEVGLTRW